MTKLTFKEIIDTLVSQEIEVVQLAYGDFNSKQFGTVKYDIETTGGEGQGEDWSTIHHFVDHDVYICIVGFYASYEGTEFTGEIIDTDTVFEVKRVERVVWEFVAADFESTAQRELKEYKEKVIKEFVDNDLKAFLAAEKQ